MQAALIWGRADGSGALLAFDWDSLTYRPAMATTLPSISSDGKTFSFTLRDDLKWSDGSAVTVDDFQFAYDQASREDNRYVQLDILQDIGTAGTLHVIYMDPDVSSIPVETIQSTLATLDRLLVTEGDPFSTRYLALVQSSPEIAAEHGRFEGVLNDIAAGR